MLSIIGNFQPALLGINLSGDAGSPKPSLLWRSEGLGGCGGWNRSIHTDLSLCQWCSGKNIFPDLLKPSRARRETRPRFVKRVAGRPFPATAATISLSLNTLCVVLRREGYVCLKRVVCSGLGRRGRGGGGVFFFLEGGSGCRCSGRGSLVEGPDLQAVDVEVLPAGERLVAECGALVSGAAVQLGVQPQAKVTAAEKRRKTWRGELIWTCNGCHWLVQILAVLSELEEEIIIKKD